MYNDNVSVMDDNKDDDNDTRILLEVYSRYYLNNQVAFLIDQSSLSTFVNFPLESR